MLNNRVGFASGSVVRLSIGFFTWLAAARLYPASQVGMAASAISAMLLCVEVGVLGSDVALISAFPRFRSSPTVLLNTAMTLAALTACTGGLIVIGLGAAGLRALHFLVAHPADGLAFLLLVLFQAGWWLMDQAAVALRRSDHVPVRAFVAATVTLTGVVALGAAGFNTAGAVLAAWAAAALTACLIGTVQISKAIGGYRFRFGLAKPLWRELVRVGLPNAAVTTADIAPGLVLPIVAAEQLSPRYAAYWYTVWMMSFAAYSIPWSFGLHLFAELADSPEELARRGPRTLRSGISIAAIATVALIVLGPTVLSILGPAYRANGTTALRIAALAAIPMVVMKAYLYTCRATGRLREGTLVATATGITAVTLAIVLAPGMGLPGIAIAWLGVQTVGALVAAIRAADLRIGTADASCGHRLVVFASADPRATVAPYHRPYARSMQDAVPKILVAVHGQLVKHPRIHGLLISIYTLVIGEKRVNRRILPLAYPGDCVWDIGANVGFYTRQFLDRWGRRDTSSRSSPSRRMSRNCGRSRRTID